jgi:hypothetical protein
LIAIVFVVHSVLPVCCTASTDLAPPSAKIPSSESVSRCLRRVPGRLVHAVGEGVVEEPTGVDQDVEVHAATAMPSGIDGREGQLPVGVG